MWIHDHKTLGKDKEIAEGEIDVCVIVLPRKLDPDDVVEQIWRHVKPQGISSAEVFAELRQGGLVRVRLEFDSTMNPNFANGGSGASIHSGDRLQSLSLSPSRFSLRGRRPHDDD